METRVGDAYSWRSVVDDGFWGVEIGVAVHGCEMKGRVSGKIQMEKIILHYRWVN